MKENTRPERHDRLRDRSVRDRFFDYAHSDFFSTQHEACRSPFEVTSQMGLYLPG
jgi:hypothetical protein